MFTNTDPARGADWTDYRPVTAMFVDLEGSVALLSELGPEDYNKALRAFHTLVTLCVRQFDGEVAQYLGDGVMCFFHRGSGDLDRASAAIAAGLELIRAMEERSGPGAPKARIGIASGLALFNDERTAAGARVLGSCINLAARLQAEAEAGCLLACGETHRLAHAQFQFNPLPPRPLKGFTGLTALWQVTGRGSEMPQSDLPASTPLPVIGRSAEMAQLQQALEAARRGTGAAVAVLGEAGLGKTRLMQEFLHEAAAAGCPRLVLRCSRDEAGRDFHPLRAWLHWVAGVAPGDDIQTRAARLEQLFTAVWGLDAGQSSDMLLLLGAHPDPGVLPSGTPLMLRRWLADQMMARLAELRGQSPALVLVLEDAHWLDPGTAELLERLRGQFTEARILWLVTQRTAGPRDLPVVAQPLVLRLAPLTPAQSAEMVQSVFGTEAAHREALDWVCSKASGVPLFIGAFAEFARRQSGSGFAGAPLPIDLLDLLEQSLVRLPGDTRRFVQAAAVMGAAFEPEVIAALQGEDATAMGRHIRLLAQERLIGRLPGGTGANFAHDLLREAIYDNLGRDLRRRLHGTLADLLARGGAAMPAELALHYDRAGLPDQAIAQYHAASIAAVRVGALQEAKGHLDKAFTLIALLEPAEERLQRELVLRRTEGPLEMMLGGPGSQAFGDTQRRSTELATELGLQSEAAQLLYNCGLHDWARLRLASAATRAQEILALPDLDEEAYLAGHTLAGLVAWHRGDNVTARLHHTKSIACYRIEDHAGMFGKYLKDFGVFSLFYAGLEASVRGEFDAARGFADRARATSIALDIPHALGFGLLAQFMTAMLRGDPEAAVRAAEPAEILARNYGFPEFEAMAIFVQGWAESREAEGRSAGIARMIRGLEGWQRTDFLAWQSLFEAILIPLLARSGRFDEAAAWLARLQGRLRSTEEHQFLAPALIAEAELRRRTGDLSGAREALHQAIARARATEAGLWLHHAEAALTAMEAL